MISRLIILAITTAWLVGTVSGKVEMSSMNVWYRQLAMDLEDLAIGQGKPIPANISEWPLVAEATSRPDKSAAYLKQATNGLAIVPDFPVINCFDKGRWREFQGSRLIAISRRIVYEKIRDDESGGRYVFLHKPVPPQIWARWFNEKDARLILKNIENFDPASQTLAFPEAGEPDYDAAGIWPRGWLLAIVAIYLTVLVVFGLCANTKARRPI